MTYGGGFPDDAKAVLPSLLAHAIRGKRLPTASPRIAIES